MLTGSCASSRDSPPPLRSELAETQRCQVPLRMGGRGREPESALRSAWTFRPTIPCSTLPQRAEWNLWIKEALGFFWVVKLLSWRLTLGKMGRKKQK